MSKPYRLTFAGLALTALVACGGGDEAVIGDEETPSIGEVTLQSDDSTATVAPLCVGEIPEDVTACPGAPDNLGQVELDQTGTATLVVPVEVSTSGFRVRLNGAPLDEHEGVLTERNVDLQIPLEAVRGDDEGVLTVEALRGTDVPPALWQFLLSAPGST